MRGEYGVFLGLDVGKGEHHPVGLAPDGKRLHDAPLPNTEAPRRALRAYVDGLRAHLVEAARVVAPGGIVAYSLANTVRAGMVFDLVAGFGQLLEEAGFVDIEAVPRDQAGRRILPAGRDTSTGRFSSNVREFASSRVREFASSRVREFASSRVREFVVFARQL